MHELYERVNEVLRVPSGTVPLRASMGIESLLAEAERGTTLEPNEVMDVTSALEALHQLRKWFCEKKDEKKVGHSAL